MTTIITTPATTAHNDDDGDGDGECDHGDDTDDRGNDAWNIPGTAVLLIRVVTLSKWTLDASTALDPRHQEGTRTCPTIPSAVLAQHPTLDQRPSACRAEACPGVRLGPAIPEVLEPKVYG